MHEKVKFISKIIYPLGVVTKKKPCFEYISYSHVLTRIILSHICSNLQKTAHFTNTLNVQKTKKLYLPSYHRIFNSNIKIVDRISG